MLGLFAVATRLLLSGVTTLDQFALCLHALGIVVLRLLARIALLAVETLRLLLPRHLLALRRFALRVLAGLLLALIGLPAAPLLGLCRRFVFLLLLLDAVCAVAAVVLRAGSGGHAQDQGRAHGS